MQQAVEQMKQCGEAHGPKVGAVLVVNGKVAGVGYRQHGTHAERAAIEAADAAGLEIAGGTVYTTLEPCVPDKTKENSKQSCSELIIERELTRVVIGSYDPNPAINRLGWKALIDAGLELRDFEPEMREEIALLNSSFEQHYTRAVGPRKGVVFDYSKNDHKFEIQFSPTDERSIVTEWSTGSNTSIHAYGRGDVSVAVAKHASSFFQIDDPRALAFGDHVLAQVNDIVVFFDGSNCVLVQINEVEGGPAHNREIYSLSIRFEVRTEVAQ